MRDVCGIAQTNNPADPEFVYFRARLVDTGEPGGDKFALMLGGTATPYAVPLLTLGTTRPGGNVQLHSPNRSTVTLPAVDELRACGGLTFNTQE